MNWLRVASIVGMITTAACVTPPSRNPSDPLLSDAPSRSTAPEFLPTWSEELSRLNLSPSGVSSVDVSFLGPILHATEGRTRKAIVVRDFTNEHKGVLIVDGIARETQFRSLFPNAKCSSDQCTTDIDRVGLRLTSATSGPSVKTFDKSHPSFQPIPGLGGFIQELHDDVDVELPPDSSPVRAYLTLEGGEFTGNIHPCHAKYSTEPDSAFRPWGNSATLRLVFAPHAVLHVITPDSGGWKQVDLKSGNVPILIANLGPKDASHFHLFKALSKVPAPADLELPAVVQRPGCRKGLGEIPGCGNSAWP